MSADFDFLIIGGGSAGYAAARTAAALGLKTGVVDGAEELGGLCILRGCMPSKTLLESASRFSTLRRAEEFGLRASGLEVRGPEILERKRRLIGEFAAYRQEQLQGGKFELVRGWARFLDANTIEATLRDGGTRRITAKTFLLATGSVVSEAPLVALKEIGCWSTDDALDSAEVPASVIILGGGATAVEFATYYSGLGREVTLIQRGGQLLKGTDPDLAAALAHGLRNRGVRVFTGTRLVGAENADGKKRIIFEHDGKTVIAEASRVLQALGRSPNTRGLALDAADIRVENGRPSTGATQQTGQPHIFAAGDVSGPYEIVHIAIQQGELAARNAARLISGGTEAMEQSDYRLKLSVVFSDPEIAVVGRGEAELREAGVAFRAASYPFNDHGKSILMEANYGYVKVIAEPKRGRILGAEIVGKDAGELIHAFSGPLAMKATVFDLLRAPWYHPTLAEIVTYPLEELAGTISPP